MKALIEAGADVLACETIPCLTEAKAIVRLLKEFPETYAWISFSAKDGLHISDGTPAADCASWLDEHRQIAALGINCTPLQHIPSLIEELKRTRQNRSLSTRIQVSNMIRKQKRGTAQHAQNLTGRAPAPGMKKERG